MNLFSLFLLFFLWLFVFFYLSVLPKTFYLCLFVFMYCLDYWTNGCGNYVDHFYVSTVFSNSIMLCRQLFWKIALCQECTFWKNRVLTDKGELNIFAPIKSKAERKKERKKGINTFVVDSRSSWFYHVKIFETWWYIFQDCIF